MENIIRFISESELIFVTQKKHLSVSHIEVIRNIEILFLKKKKENMIKRQKEGNVYNFVTLLCT